MSSVETALNFENLLYEKKDSIGIRNPQPAKGPQRTEQDSFLELKAAFEDARDDANVRGVIVTGSGDKAFAAGADIAKCPTTRPSRQKKQHGVRRE